MCAFLRSHGDATALVATARFPSRFQGGSFGRGTALALPEALHATRWRDALTGREMRAEDGALAASAVLAALPAAVLLPAALRAAGRLPRVAAGVAVSAPVRLLPPPA